MLMTSTTRLDMMRTEVYEQIISVESESIMQRGKYGQ